MPSDTGVPALVKGDVVKLQIGVHIDGVSKLSFSFRSNGHTTCSMVEMES
jgi:methionine aminopeptidase